ncbi:hypothetical protein HMI54_013403, partial [Coelomomyces lativittatus]
DPSMYAFSFSGLFKPTHFSLFHLPVIPTLIPRFFMPPSTSTLLLPNLGLPTTSRSFSTTPSSKDKVKIVEVGP